MAYEDTSLDHADTPSVWNQLGFYQALRDRCTFKRHSLYPYLQRLIQKHQILNLNWRLGRSKPAETSGTKQTLIWTRLQQQVVITVLQRLFLGLQLQIAYLWFTVKRVVLLFQQTEVMVQEISRLAEAEAAIEPTVDFSTLPDIRPFGDAGLEQKTVVLTDEQREFPPGTQRKRQFRVLLCTPQRWRSGKTPVVVISHGLGSKPEAFRDYAAHLTSYGYVVALPQHPGSDDDRLWESLTGRARDIFNLEEFIDRPLDVSYVLDQLEQRNQAEYGGRLDLENVGVMGHSFGGYTALAMAGAEINFEDLNTVCALTPGLPNLSLILQCRALGLPRRLYNCRDHRVKAILSIDPVGSEVFGAKGLGSIQIPILIVAGSEDRTTPAVFEQIRVFPWLTTPDRYLALIEGKAHLGSFSNLDATLNLILRRMTNLKGLNSSIFYSYINSLSLAFFEVYLANNPAYTPYLQSSYARFISQAPFHLSLISAASCSATSCDQIDQKLRDFILQISQFN